MQKVRWPLAPGPSPLTPMNAKQESLAELLGAFKPDLPLEQARTIPSAWYFDPELHVAECRKIFGRTWQVAGRLDQLAQPGAFVTTEVAGESILVVRDKDGELRAFFNVCRHRAARVVQAPEGHASRLRCPYHGWTYDLAGKLLGTPEFEGVADFQREEHGLVPLDVNTWGPFVWVRQERDEGGRMKDVKTQPEDSSFILHPSSSLCPPLLEFLSPVESHLGQFGLDAFHWVERREYNLKCNWKVFVDNYLDGGYHVNSIHPGLAGVIDYSRYRTEIDGFTSSQISPFRPAKPGPLQAQVSDVRRGSQAVYSWIFPNFMINVCEGVMDTNLVLPLGPEECQVIFDFYFIETGAEAKQFILDSIAVSHQVQVEDQLICEDVQKGLASKSFDTGRFSVRREGAGYHFHRLLARFLH